jgi:hypothetical protein
MPNTPFPATKCLVLEHIALAFGAYRRRLPGPLRVHWVPGHSDIRENELVDKLAKEGAALIPLVETKETLSFLRGERSRNSGPTPPSGGRLTDQTATHD